MKSWPFHKIMMDRDLPGEHFRRCILVRTPTPSRSLPEHQVKDRGILHHRGRPESQGPPLVSWQHGLEAVLASLLTGGAVCHCRRG